MNIKYFSRFLLCLIIPCLVLAGCAKDKNLTDYHQVGETFSVSYGDNRSCTYDITVVDHVANSHFTLDIHKVSLDCDDAYVYICSPYTDKIVVDGVEYTEETWLPVVYPYGVYDISLDAENTTVQIYFSDEYEYYEGNGYISANIEAISGGNSVTYYCIRFSAY